MASCTLPLQRAAAGAVHDSAEYQRLLDDLWRVSSVARRNTPPFISSGAIVVNVGLSLIDISTLSLDTGEAHILTWDRYVIRVLLVLARFRVLLANTVPVVLCCKISIMMILVLWRWSKLGSDVVVGCSLGRTHDCRGTRRCTAASRRSLSPPA